MLLNSRKFELQARETLSALARGAKAVLLWGLALDGEAGVGRVLDLLIEEFDLALSLCGCRSLAEVTPDLLADHKLILQSTQ